MAHHPSHSVRSRRLGFCGTLMLLTALLSLGSTSTIASSAAATAREYHQTHRRQIISDFAELLRLPNIASELDDMQRNARFIERYVQARGFTTKTVSAGGAPYVFAERAGTPGATSVLIYAHYDGQPVVAADWSSPPFEPTLWTGMPGALGSAKISLLQDTYDPEWRLAARSAGDDKGPIIALMAAIDALTAADSMPDINIKLILDGEEERGSPTLAGILDLLSDELAADLLLFCDGPMHQSRRRQLTLGVRGSMTVDIKTFGANRPLHSGHYGNWSPNPADTLVRLLQSLKDKTGKPAVDGFLADAAPVTDSERRAIAAMPRIDDRLLNELGLQRSEQAGERIEEAIMRPAIVVRGLYGGAVGAQGRNIIEPEASASLNIRLVPGQSPAKVFQQLTQHFSNQGMRIGQTPPPADAPRETFLQMTLRPGGYRAFRTPVDAPVVQRLKQIMDELPGDETLIAPTMGGSLPIYLFEDKLDMPIVILPIANHDNNQHGRNENLRLRNLFDAIELYAALLTGLADA